MPSKQNALLLLGVITLAPYSTALPVEPAGAAAGVTRAPGAQEPQMSREPEAVSLLGKPLYPMALTPERSQKLEEDLAQARAAFDDNPDALDNIIWLGRRLAYLGRYREAIAVYTRGLERWPTSYRLLRHRGHRWISVRELDRAIVDLERAVTLIEGVPDAIEPDGAPNRYNIPRSTSHSNIWYHLGLAYYLRGDFEEAARCYRECMKFSDNDDMLCATTDWLYMTYRRLGQDEAARALLQPIRAEMAILENHAYHKRLLMYKGELAADSLLSPEGASDLDLATQGYGVGNWYLCSGDTAAARATFERVVEGTYWPAFGYIAAECELLRLR
jgi:tetratricopeptide (TPR) repeat protein